VETNTFNLQPDPILLADEKKQSPRPWITPCLLRLNGDASEKNYLAVEQNLNGPASVDCYPFGPS
jgi:hypothetical protein